MRLIAIGLATALLTGAASVAVATDASAATPTFNCFKTQENGGTPDPHNPIPATEKSKAQKDGFVRCFKVTS